MKLDIIRAWKDETYRQSLSNEELSLLPASPVGEMELSDADLEAVNGGNGGHNHNVSYGCFNTFATICLQSSFLIGFCFTVGSVGGSC